MKYRRVIQKLESRGIMPTSTPSLAATREGLIRLELKIDPARCIVVAGTNGKGSVCAILDRLFHTAGIRTGLYTSPHLMEYTERIRVAGTDISRKLFTEAYHAVDAVTSDLSLTHFETLTLMAAWIFASGKSVQVVEWMIFEVGLGGSWDATNAIPHQNCVITRIGLDHQELLGTTLAEVAENKFGIISPGCRVIHTKLDPSLRKQPNWIEAPCYEQIIDHIENEPEYILKTPWGNAKLALAGQRGAENASLALKVFETLITNHITAENLAALTEVRWPGRMQRMATAPCPVYFSGDHNPQGIQSLLELLPQYRRRHLHLLVGLGRDKDLDGVMAPLFSLPNTSIYLTQTPFKGRLVTEYGKWSEKVQSTNADPNAAFQKVMQVAAPEDMILVTGSLYLIGALMKGNYASAL